MLLNILNYKIEKLYNQNKGEIKLLNIIVIWQIIFLIRHGIIANLNFDIFDFIDLTLKHLHRMQEAAVVLLFNCSIEYRLKAKTGLSWASKAF